MKIGLIIGGLGIIAILIFMTYCCLKVGAKADKDQ